ncbi:restriction endonuclease subunit S [Sphingomonas sp. PP-CE-1G-424]|uniref:restriction endonuclease subunit S n=1 Tax=Sphingomonas sp. PP-CE-1G-424 TaxID=2135658 RepID=UPI001054C491|nr:restriction endonuclease subunit S [Sphingomonas sp. PP-CE-1G-424]TCP66134.1 type I restriction enzyme S subunit [Sphingomonas sp. PP-CE-1G-424]
MNAALLLEHYARIADAPDAIARLRRFVLDLAVRGKLVEQDAADEPSSALFERLVAAKNKLVASEGFNTASEALERKPNEFPFNLPHSWIWCWLDDIAAIARGGSPRPIQDFMTAEENGIPWIKIGDAVRGEVYINQVKERIRPEGAKRSRMVFPGDLLLSNSMSFGFPYITNVTGCIHDGWLVIRIPENMVDKRYLQSLFLSDFARKAFANAAAGAVVQNLNADKVRRLPVPLPPLTEQHRIVAKVDKLMALCDQLEAARAAREAARDTFTLSALAKLNAPDPETFAEDARFTLANLTPLATRPDQIKQLRQTILDLAVHGRLVEQDPSDEPVANQLQRISGERHSLVQAKAIRREKPLDPIGGEHAPFEIPPVWAWCRIGDAALFTQYGTSEKSEPGPQGVPVLTMGNIQDGRVVWNNEKRIPASSEELPSLYLKKFDLLYNRTNSAELVGKTGIYLGEDDCRTFASYLIRIRCSVENSLPAYVNLAMNAPVFRETQIVPLIKQQTGQANVNGTALKNMRIPLPPLAEQHRIIAKVDELMVLCDQLEASITMGEQTRSRLLEAVLHDALEPV